MKFTNIAVISMMSFLLVACGGESSSSAPVPVTPVVEEPVTLEESEEEPEPELDPNAIYDTTAELIAAKSFLLKQEYELLVSYNTNNNRSAYLSVCTEFTEDQDIIKVNYNSCLLRTSIESNYAGKLTVSNDKNRLVMAIWYLDDIKKPRYEVWENNSDVKGEKTFKVN